MTNHHDLNKLLADVAGVEIFESGLHKKIWNYTPLDGDPDNWEEWNPLEDANQMELVKAGLRRKGWYVCIDLFPQGGVKVFLYRFDGPNNLPQFHLIVTKESEAMALALAIEKMKGEG